MDNVEKRDDFLIIVSTIVAILAAKVADFTLPVFTAHKYFNIPQIDPWFGLVFNVIALILVVLGILKFVKWITKKIMDD